MTILNKKYEFEIEENKVYQLRRINFTNVESKIYITGTGSIDLLHSVQIPTSLNDPILVSNVEDNGLAEGVYSISETNFIKLAPNGAGSRVITLVGFNEPIVKFE